MKDYPKAVAELREAVNKDPSDWTPHSLLAQALEMTSNLDGAIAEARESVRVTPNNPPALLSLAKLLEKKETSRARWKNVNLPVSGT